MQELRALADRYAVTVDAGDAEAFAALFADDAFLEANGHRYDGVEAIAAIPSKLRRYDATMHLVSTHHATTTGRDRAAGVTYCEAHHRAGEADRVLFIRYDDEYSRGDDSVWRFASRRLTVVWTEER